MIVHPDFFHHFKTRKLIKLTRNDAAPLWVLKLWAYCHIKHTSRFENLSDATLAGICEYENTQVPIMRLLLDCGFIVQDGNTIIVHDWDKANAQLLASWHNGRRGGWPGAKRTNGQPTGSPRVTHGQPTPSHLINKSTNTREECPGSPRVSGPEPTLSAEEAEKNRQMFAKALRQARLNNFKLPEELR